MTPPVDIEGFEYDWLASDAAGYVAFFSTAGGSYAPPELRDSPESYEVAIEAILASPPTTSARFAPIVSAGCTNTWLLMAERGLFAFDGDFNGGPYRLVAAPEQPIRIDALPTLAIAPASALWLRNARFAERPELTTATLKLELTSSPKRGNSRS